MATMKRASHMTGALLIALCLGSILAGGANAAAKSLHLTYEGSKLVVGHEVEAYDTAWEIRSTVGNVSCAHDEKNEGFLGKDETNDAKTDAISVEKAFGRFDESHECNITIPEFQASRAVWANTNSNSSAVKGQFKLSSSRKAEYVTSSTGSTVIALESPGGSFCFWEVKKLKGTTGSFPGHMTAAFENQKLKLLKEATEIKLKSSVACPKQATLTTSVRFYVPLGEGAEAALDGGVS
jgi:hypothetical protein